MVNQARLKELLSYNEITGIFYRATKTERTPVGAPVGTKNTSGYLMIRLDGVLYYAHRLVWLWAHGKWPDQTVDHINGIKTDNRLANLRDIDARSNAQNNRNKRRNNTTGYQGVILDKRDGKFVAQIKNNRTQHAIGKFDSAKDAHTAYLAVKRKMHPSFSG